MKEKELEKILKSLANKRRLTILSLLKSQKEATVGFIAEKLKLSYKATSKHLGILFSVNILEKDQKGSQMFFKMASNPPEPARRIINLL